MLFVGKIQAMKDYKVKPNVLIIKFGPYINKYELEELPQKFERPVTRFGNLSYSSTRAPTPQSVSRFIQSPRSSIQPENDLIVRKMRVYYVFSLKADIQDFLENERVIYELYETNRLVASGVSSAFTKLSPFFCEPQLQQADSYLFKGAVPWFNLRVTSGLSREEPGKFIPPTVLPMNGVLYPPSTYHTPEPLPLDWVGLFLQNKVVRVPEVVINRERVTSAKKTNEKMMKQRIQSATVRSGSISVISAIYSPRMDNSRKYTNLLAKKK